MGRATCAGRRRDRRRLGARARARASARPRPRAVAGDRGRAGRRLAERGWREPRDPGHRQLRHLHLQPGPVSRRAAVPRWCVYRNDAGRRRRDRGARADRIVISPGPVDPREAGISVDAVRLASPASCRSSASASATRRSVRRSAARVIAPAEPVHGKTSRDPPRRPQRASPGCRPVRGDPLPLPGGRAREPGAGVPGGRAPGPTTGSSWASATGTAPGRGRAVPPRVDPDRRGQAAARTSCACGR